MRRGRDARFGRSSKVWESVDQALEPTVLEAHDVEVEEEPEVDARELEVGQDLRFVDGGELANSLDFDEDHALDQQVDPIARIDEQFTVPDRELLLTLDGQPTTPEFVLETRFIGRLQESGSQGRMHMECRTQNALRELVQGGLVPPVACSANPCFSAVESGPIAPPRTPGHYPPPISPRPVGLQVGHGGTPDGDRIAISAEVI